MQLWAPDERKWRKSGMTVKKSKGGNKRQGTVVWVGGSFSEPIATKRKSDLHSHQTAPSSRAKPVPCGSTQRWLQRGGMRGITYCQQVEGRDGLPLLTSHPSDRSSWTHDSVRTHQQGVSAHSEQKVLLAAKAHKKGMSLPARPPAQGRSGCVGAGASLVSSSGY